MVKPEALPERPAQTVTGYRLINSKFPPIALFDDVADESEFAALHALQALTNPRLQNEAGNLALLPTCEIPFGIRGCSYAVAPFTHVNPDGSRFSDGSFGVLYVADLLATAIAEVKYHQQAYWQNVEGLHFERFVFRGLKCIFDERGCRDAKGLEYSHPVYAPDDYHYSRALGWSIREACSAGLRYRSVREPGATCWALMTPIHVRDIVQTTHLEMIWNGRVTQVNRLSACH
ncbi:RES family NAD+ phosphorylase [Halomonas aquamarina]|uniref:RES family NAD+ phosphorylase n=1 Tax=Vreelandella aquamarina TaxID=77097 RepID=A0ACC5VRH3_9GAMM|nr:RES family NAD+ phosphorylase [Halomonas aquamarina]MBZ5486866.1 RES family NAD+ phosphorylase [Halomonas aquamarina]